MATKKKNHVKKDISELKNTLQRLAADFENYKKRVEENRESERDRLKAEFLMKFVPIIDNFNRAFSHIPEKSKKEDWVLGIEHIQKQFENILENEGLEKIETRGEKFNPHLHEAVHCQVDKKVKNDHIISELESGWKIGDKAIKCAKVVVCKK